MELEILNYCKEISMEIRKAKLNVLMESPVIDLRNVEIESINNVLRRHELPFDDFKSSMEEYSKVLTVKDCMEQHCVYEFLQLLDILEISVE
jgi:hypothetical protein